MPLSKFERFLPLAGIIVGVLFAVVSYVPVLPDQGGAPDALQVMQDHEIRNQVASIGYAYLSVVLLFFAAGVRQALRSGEPGESSYSSVAYAGGILLAASQAVNAWLVFAGLEAAGQGNADVMTVLTYLGSTQWILWAVPSAVLLLSTGLGGLRNAVLPRWFAIVTIVLGVMNLLGPSGILVYVVSPLWFMVAGVLLTRRLESRTATEPHAAGV